MNLLDPEFYVDPFDGYRWLRDESPVHWDPVQKLWGISRHADVMAVENDAALYSSFDGSRPHTDQRDDSSMINKDDPEHQRQRMVVARRFTPRGVRSHEDRVRAAGHRAARRGARGGRVRGGRGHRLAPAGDDDLRAIGYPMELWPAVRRWSEVTMFEAGQTPADGTPQGQSDASTQAIMEFAEETMKVLAQRREDPKDDLISVWAHTEVHGQAWTEKEVLEEAILVLDGGAETTRAVIAAILLELARRPDQRQKLVEDPSLLEGPAVEEFIRFVSPISNMRRTVRRDHELHGQQLHEGDEVLLLYGSANRDDRVFTEPEGFDVARPRNSHVAFGFGTHFCLGASLARLELRVLFDELVRRGAHVGGRRSRAPDRPGHLHPRLRPGARALLPRRLTPPPPPTPSPHRLHPSRTGRVLAHRAGRPVRPQMRTGRVLARPPRQDATGSWAVAW